MCSQYQIKLPLHVVEQSFSHTRFPLRFPAGRPNVEPRDQVTIGDVAPVVIGAGDHAELQTLPFSWKGPGGRPVFNFRSEGRRFEGTTRCLVTVSGFYEFTAPEEGQKRKTKWLFTLKGQDWFWLVGIVRDGGFALLTVEPGEDIRPYHDRQVVALGSDDGESWLTLAKPEGELLQPLAGGSLAVEKVFPVAPATLL